MQKKRCTNQIMTPANRSMRQSNTDMCQHKQQCTNPRSSRRSGSVAFHVRPSLLSLVSLIVSASVASSNSITLSSYVKGMVITLIDYIFFALLSCQLLNIQQTFEKIWLLMQPPWLLFLLRIPKQAYITIFLFEGVNVGPLRPNEALY